MVSSKEESLIYNIKLSSVGPGRMTGQDIIYEPTNMDLATKLHYLRAVYYLRAPAFEGLSIFKIKEPLFTWFNHYYMTCGRFRRAEDGRPYIKCNDCGARIIEAQCDKTLDEWLQLKDLMSLQKLLVSDQVLGPELAFSPPVYLQMTKFKCGGVAVGLSWAHVLGDAFCAADFMNMWGQVAAGHKGDPPRNLVQSLTKPAHSPSPTKVSVEPVSLKRVNPVGDHWISRSNYKLEAFSLHISSAQVSQVQAKISEPNLNPRVGSFEALCAIIWQCVARARDGPEPKVITICKKDSKYQKEGPLSNGQIISVVETNIYIAECKPKELAMLISNEAVDDRKRIEDVVKRDPGSTDFVMYGANLTFVDLEEANLYGFEMRGEKPINVSYNIDGIGEEGLVLVHPMPNNPGDAGVSGRIVNIIVPEDQFLGLKSELTRELFIA